MSFTCPSDKLFVRGSVMLQHLHTDTQDSHGSKATIVNKKVIRGYEIFFYVSSLDKTVFTGYYSGMKSRNVTS